MVNCVTWTLPQLEKKKKKEKHRCSATDQTKPPAPQQDIQGASPVCPHPASFSPCTPFLLVYTRRLRLLFQELCMRLMTAAKATSLIY